MLKRRSKNVISSLKSLISASFTVVNYDAAHTNLTIVADTKAGVLGGSVATIAGNYLVGQGLHTDKPCGLFASDAIPDNFMNAPALAGGKVGVAQFGGEFEVDVFETNAHLNEASILGTYSVDKFLYASAAGLLTVEVPTAVSVGSGEDIAIGRVTWVPTETNLILGLDMLM